MAKRLNFDNFNLIVHADGDGGDSCADTFRYLYGTHLAGAFDHETYNAAIKHFFILPGVGIRHPAQWNDPCDFSRDQQTPAVIVLNARGNLPVQDAIELRHKGRGWRYQNLDWATWEHRNYYRPTARDPRGDSLLLVNACIRWLDSWLWPEGSIARDQNFMMSLMQIARAGHSETTKLARNIYRRRRLGPVYALEHYYRVDNPGIAELWKPHVIKLIVEDT